jgi:hypothetical protein
MSVVQELLNGGVVTARASSLLKEGELQQADDCILRPFTPAVFKAPGRVSYGRPTGANAKVKGIRHLSFDSDNDILLSYVGPNFYRSDYLTATGGTFVPMAGAGQVDNCTFGSGSPNITTTGNAFANMIKGALIYNAKFPVGTYVLSITDSNHIVASGNSTSAEGTGTTIEFNAGVVVTYSDDTTTDLDILDSVAYNNAHFLITRTNPVQKLFYTSVKDASSPVTNRYATMRQAGMTPVNNFQATNVAKIAGTWPTNSQFGVGWYYFLITEMINPGTDDEVESSFVINSVCDRQPIHILDVATEAVRITFPTTGPVNNGLLGSPVATHYQIYISPRQADVLPIPSLSIFIRLGSPIPVSLASFDLIDNITKSAWLPAGSVANESGYRNWNNSSRAIGNPDRLIANTTGATSAPVTSSLILSTFGLTNNGLTVRGVEVEVMGNVGSGFIPVGSVGVSLRGASGTKISSERFVKGFGTSYGPHIVGGGSDQWDVGWLASDLTSLEVIVHHYMPGQIVNLDSIRVSVSYGNLAMVTSGIAFPTVTYKSQVGFTVTEGANLPPPLASTGDIFEGQLVLNDRAHPSTIVYSLPTKPDAFPAPYYIDFQSRKKDIVTCIRRLNTMLIVGLQSSVKRVNYLPTENDADFGNRGRCQEDLCTDHGISGPLAAEVVDMPMMGSVLVYVSNKGIHVTDGISVRNFNEDLDWANLIDKSYIQNTILVNYPALYTLVMYYTPVGATTNTKAIWFNYHVAHQKGGSIPAMGPNSVSGRSACLAILGGVSKLYTGHNTDGFIYNEDNGTTDGAGGNILPNIRTRLFYPAGIGSQARLERFWIFVGAFGDATTGLATLTLRRQNINEAEQDNSSTDFTTVAGGLVAVHCEAFGEAFSIKIAKGAASTASMRIDFLAYKGLGHGEESHRS